MSKMATTSVFQSDVFTFEVGATKEQFIIHKKAIEQYSQVLTTLMNNGMMQESTTGVAWLEHVDPKVFGLFAEFVYTGVYRVVPSSTSDRASLPGKTHKFVVYCVPCGSRTVDALSSAHPSACPGCRSSHVDVYNLNTNAYPIQSKSQQHNSGDKWAAELAFKNLKFSALDKDHQSLREHLSALHPPDKVTNQVSSHAMLYVFAQEYMVETLMKLCLHKLHRDLLALEINALTIVEIVKTLTYVYENTSGSNEKDKTLSSEEGIGQGLRNLVKLYAIWTAKRLMTYDSFQTMLRDGGDIVSDFTRGLSNRLSE